MSKHFFKSFLGISFFFIFLFLAAGRIDYWQGWLYYGVSMLGLAINFFTSKNADLIQERDKPGADVQNWDKKILGLLALLTVIAYVIAGLDSGRFFWTAPFSAGLIALGVSLSLAGQIIFAVAKYQNNFFSSVVRHQKDRNHQVCDRGLYKIVRHPGYLGMIIPWVGFPLILNSLYSIVPALLGMILLIVRTSLEDQFLAKELAGYKEFQQQTKYRLFPFIW
jgi:protein-S-isoprenylcysteine O-methyltransferase Ste14